MKNVPSFREEISTTWWVLAAFFFAAACIDEANSRKIKSSKNLTFTNIKSELETVFCDYFWPFFFSLVRDNIAMDNTCYEKK